LPFFHYDLAGRKARSTLNETTRPQLIATVSGPVHQVANTWEANREVLDTKTNSLLTGSVISSCDYSVNNVGQRTQVATSGSAFAAASGWTWGYDALGQVTSAAHATDTALNQNYLFDDIGNRKESGTGLQPS